VAGEGDVRGVANDPPAQDLSLISRALAGPSTLDPTDVDTAMAIASESRTPEGFVDPEAVTRLAEVLPVIEPDGPGNAALTDFVSSALGQDVALTTVGGGGAKGLSGAPVHLVRDDSGAVVAIAKIFPKFEEYVRELSSLQRLAMPEFARFHVPEPLAVAVIQTPDGPAGVMVASVAPGRAIDDVIAAVGTVDGPLRAERMAELTRAVSDTAAALAELHTGPSGSGGRVHSSYLDFHIGLAQRLTDEVLAARDIYEELGGLLPNELRTRIDLAITATEQAQLGSALVHGDAHPGNFFWDPQAGVTFIDTPTFHYSMDANGSPIASPERDVSNFQQRLAHYSRTFGLDPVEVAHLQDAFLQSYRDSGGATLNPDAMRMFGARSVLNKLIQLGDEVRVLRDESLEGGSTDPAMLRSRIEDMVAEVDLLMRSLGWDE